MALHGSNVVLLLDGFDMSPYFREFSMEGSQAFHDATVFGNSSRVKVPGLKDGKASGTGFFDPTAVVGSFVVLKGKFTGSSPASASSAIVTMGLNGLAVGGRVQMGFFDEASLDTKVVLEGLEMLTFAGDADQDGIDYGVSLHALAAETAFTFTGTAVDNAVQTTNGGVGVIHVTAIAGASPNLTFKIQHSVDNSVWVDLIATFTAITSANQAQRVEVAAGTTIRRYTRVLVTNGGTTSSCTFVAAFARR